tara:strand:- start:156 stop:797 length:642 start_codon:yes stop_codon:yes gene_type:complete
MNSSSETIGKLAEALGRVQGELGSIAKQSKGYNYQYADLATVWDGIRKPLSTNGLAVVQTTDSDDIGNPIIITTLIHTSGEWISGKLAVKPVKPDPQALGSAITYGRRYTLMAIVGVAPADDDGAEASKPAPKRATRLVRTIPEEWENKPAPKREWAKQSNLTAFKAGYKQCLALGASAESLPKLRQDANDDQIDTAIVDLRKIYTALKQESS